MRTAGGCPEQVNVIVAGAPPLYASRLTTVRGNKKVIVPSVLEAVSETLLVVNAPQGLDWNHWPLPQSIRPTGYAPFKG
jgi:hypothetical protein